MLPNNHRFTDIIKQLKDKHPTKQELINHFYGECNLEIGLSDTYFRKLSNKDQKKFRELYEIHLKALLAFFDERLVNNLPRDLLSTPPLRPSARAERSSYSSTPPMSPIRQNPSAQSSFQFPMSQEPRPIHVYLYRPQARWYDWNVFSLFSPQTYTTSLFSTTNNTTNHITNNYYYQNSTPVSGNNTNATNNTDTKTEEKKNGNTSGDEALGWGMILLAGLSVAAATVATLYTTIEAARAIEQIAYMEDILGNMTKLALTAFGGVLGGNGGFLMGAAMFNAPVFGAIVGTLILTGLTITSAKYIVEAIHSMSNYDSALGYDPRFCLSNRDKARLTAEGYNVDAVSEAIREAAISYDFAHQSSWSLMFWSPEQKIKAEMVDLMRSLKNGVPAHRLTINNKRFNFEATEEGSILRFNPNSPVLGEVVIEPSAKEAAPIGYQL